jgi:hypothetical protein
VNLLKPSGHVLLSGLIYLAFISLGLPDSVLGVAWPQVRSMPAICLA